MDFVTLTEQINEFNNISNQNNQNNKNIPKIKDIRGNQHDLQQFNYQMRRSNYIKQIKDEKKGFKQHETDTFDSMEEVFNNVQNMNLSKQWNRIKPYYKKELVTKYLDNLLCSSKISIDEYKKMKSDIYLKIEEKKLNSKIVDYNPETCCINNITL